jgi:predicted RND superfamily exporter protein
MYQYLNVSGSSAIGNMTLGEDSWPVTEEAFVFTLKNYVAFGSPGAQMYGQSIIFSEDGSKILAIKVESQFVRLTKLNGDEMIDDADRQIEAMDDTRAMLESWTDLPSNFPYSKKFINIEGFKSIKKELFLNVGLAIVAVGIIVFLTVGSAVTSFLITFNVAMCIIEILGFMHAFGIVIDSVSVINMVLAVGLSVDYSAHIGHSFMTKKGSDKNKRTTEALADMGQAVLSGAISTFLAVAVLLFSKSYVFRVLSTQFALTVALGIIHGLLLLPVMLSVLGPKSHKEKEKESPDSEAP